MSHVRLEFHSGNVELRVAHGAIAQELADSYVFIDINEKKAEADAQDFKDLWQIYLAMQTLLSRLCST